MSDQRGRFQGTRLTCPPMNWRRSCLACLVIGLAALAPFHAQPGAAAAAPKPPRVTAKAAAILDVPTGRFVWLRNPDSRRAMASTTKIMTARVVLQSGVPLSRVMTVPDLDMRWDEQGLAFEAGEKYTVETLLRAMLVASAGDAARTLAVGVAGSEKEFVARMNAEAERLDLDDTRYANVSGMDAGGHHTTARQLTQLAADTMFLPDFTRHVRARSVTIRRPGKAALTVPNTNHLLLEHDWVTGVKTGFTSDAGYCLVASGVYRKRDMIVTVLGSASSEDRFQDARRLFRYGASLYKVWRSPEAGHVQATASVPYSRRPLALELDERFTVPVPPGVVVSKRVVAPRVVTAPVAGGQALGEVSYTVMGESRHKSRLVAARAVPQSSWQTRLRYRLHSVWDRIADTVGLSLRRLADPRAVLRPVL